jgi:hypothetical protein
MSDSEKRIASTPRRGLPRFALALDAWLRDGDRRIPVKVSDLSCDGCRVEGGIFLEQATEIWLKIKGMTPFAARVAWSREGKAGCEFLTPLDEELVGRLQKSAVGGDGKAIDRRQNPEA